MLRKYYIICVVILLSISGLSAKDRAFIFSNVEKGELSSKIPYYLINDKIDKGFVNFSIIQTNIKDTNVNNILSEQFKKFVIRHNIAPNKKSYLKYILPCTRKISFDNIPINQKEVVDSALLMIFSIIKQTNTKQALIIKGNFDRKSILERLSLLSLTIDSSEHSQSLEIKRYPLSAIKIDKELLPNQECLTLNFSLDVQKNLSNLSPIVEDFFASSFSKIVNQRIEHRLLKKKILFNSLKFNYIGSKNFYDKQLYSFSINCDKKDIFSVNQIITEVLVSLKNNKVELNDFVSLKSQYISSLYDKDYKEENDYLVYECITNFLFESKIFDKKKVADYLSKKREIDSRECVYFNEFINQLIIEKNLRINLVKDKDTTLVKTLTSLSNNILTSYSNTFDNYIHSKDSLYLMHNKYTEKKIDYSIEQDKTNKATIFSFDNGIKVVYKKLSANKQFCYKLFINRGISSLSNLDITDGKHFTSILASYDVAGFKHSDFQHIMSLNSIKMNYDIGLSDMSISGFASSSKLKLLLNSLLALANERNLTPQINNIDAQIVSQADKYFDEQFSSLNDGFLFIVGDLEKEEVESLLKQTIPYFNTAKRRSVRPILSDKTINEASNDIDFSPSNNKFITIKRFNLLSFSTENYILSKIAIELIKEEIGSYLLQYPCSLELSSRFDLSAPNIFNLILNILPLDKESNVLYTRELDKERIVSDITFILNNIADKKITKQRLDDYKKLYTKQRTELLKNPYNYLEMLCLKYAYRRDIYTNYDLSLKRIDIDKLHKFLTKLQFARGEVFMPKEK